MVNIIVREENFKEFSKDLMDTDEYRLRIYPAKKDTKNELRINENERITSMKIVKYNKEEEERREMGGRYFLSANQ